jgi:uncharacterized protein (DUF2342 family)
MTVIEGHAEFFTNLFSKDLVPGLDTTRRKLGVMKKLKYKILGLDKLLARYKDGERFISVLYEYGGAKLANTPLGVLPTRQEIELPGQYIDRIDGGETVK